MSSLLLHPWGALKQLTLVNGFDDERTDRENRTRCDESLAVGVGDAHTNTYCATIECSQKTLFTKKSNTLIPLANKSAGFVERTTSDFTPNQLLIGVENLSLILAQLMNESHNLTTRSTNGFHSGHGDLDPLS